VQLWHPMLLVFNIGATHNPPFGITVIVVNMPHSLCKYIIGNPYIVQLPSFLNPLA
jgi:hypothetical protein